MKKPSPGLARPLPLLALAFPLVLMRRARARAPEPAPPYPPTRTTTAADVLHGVTVPDPYRWLEDAKSPEVQAWMKAEDDLARQRLAALPGRDAIAARARDGRM